MSDPVFVSEVIGEGADAHRLVRVGAWELRAQGPAGTEPMVRDLDAAERLGFTRPRKIRELIERIWPEGRRPVCRPTVGRQSTGNGGTREFAVDEYWLTEAQLLKVIARSKTDIAEAILDDMIRVYMAARRGLQPRAAQAEQPLPRAPQFADAAAQLPPSKRATMLRRELTRCGRAYADVDPKRKSAQSWRGFVDAKVRAAAGFAAGPKCSFELMTSDQWGAAVIAVLGEMETVRRLTPPAQSGQGTLFPEKAP